MVSQFEMSKQVLSGLHKVEPSWKKQVGFKTSYFFQGGAEKGTFSIYSAHICVTNADHY